MFRVAVTWWPFELHPETPVEGRDVDEIIAPSRRTQEYRDHLKAYAAEAGIKLASNRIVANSHRALELAEFARDNGKFDQVHDRLFEAYFEEAKNIGDDEVVTAIAEEAGLDVDAWRTEMVLGRYRQLIDHTTNLARQQGVTSTPTMIFDDKFVLLGAQELQTYVDVLTRLGAERIDGEQPGPDGEPPA